MTINWINTPTTLLVALKDFIVAITFLENMLNSYLRIGNVDLCKGQGLAGKTAMNLSEYLKQFYLF